MFEFSIIQLIFFYQNFLTTQCIAECIAQELGAMKNRTVDKEAAKLLFVNLFGKDPHFAPIIGGAFDKCYDRVIAIPEHKDAKCNFAPAFLMTCVETELFKVG